MKKYVFMAATIILLGSCNIQETKKTEMCSAQEWCDRIECGWVLGNSLASYIEGAGDTLDVETCWGNPRTTEEMVDSVAAAGFNALRLSVRWYPHFTDTINAVVDTTWMKRIKQIADWGLKNNMQIMINTDHEEWLELQPYYRDSTNILRKEFNLWRQIAEFFRDYDDRLAFVGTGEPHAGEFFSKPTEENLFMQKRFNQVFVDAVRSTGGNNSHRNLIVQTYQTDPRFCPEAFEKPFDSTEGHLIVEIHYYYPFLYTIKGWNRFFGKKYEHVAKKAGEPNIDAATLQAMTAAATQGQFINIDEIINKQLGVVAEDPELEETMRKMKDLFIDKGLPVVIGEIGASQWYNEGEKYWEQIRDSRVDYYRETISAARRYNIPCFVFDDGLKGKGEMYFSFFDRHNNMKVINPLELKTIIEASKRK